jgi:hypothetical protein
MKDHFVPTFLSTTECKKSPALVVLIDEAPHTTCFYERALALDLHLSHAFSIRVCLAPTRNKMKVTSVAYVAALWPASTVLALDSDTVPLRGAPRSPDETRSLRRTLTAPKNTPAVENRRDLYFASPEIAQQPTNSKGTGEGEDKPNRMYQGSFNSPYDGRSKAKYSGTFASPYADRSSFGEEGATNTPQTAAPTIEKQDELDAPDLGQTPPKEEYMFHSYFGNRSSIEEGATNHSP